MYVNFGVYGLMSMYSLVCMDFGVYGLNCVDSDMYVVLWHVCTIKIPQQVENVTWSNSVEIPHQR